MEPTSITTLKLKVGKGGNQKSWGKEGRYTVEKKRKEKISVLYVRVSLKVHQMPENV